MPVSMEALSAALERYYLARRRAEVNEAAIGRPETRRPEDVLALLEAFTALATAVGAGGDPCAGAFDGGAWVAEPRVLNVDVEFRIEPPLVGFIGLATKMWRDRLNLGDLTGVGPGYRWMQRVRIYPIYP